MTTATRLIEFCSGHRVVGHEGKCRNLHGHNYRAEFTCKAIAGLDDVGRVVDFSVIKMKLKGWIDDHWDHRMILWKEDLLVPYLKEIDSTVVTVNNNPTAENLAADLHQVANELLKPHNVECVNVRVWETPNCYVDSQ